MGRGEKVAGPKSNTLLAAFFQIQTINLFQTGEGTATAEIAIAHGTDLADVLERERYLRFRRFQRFGKVWQSKFVEFK